MITVNPLKFLLRLENFYDYLFNSTNNFSGLSQYLDNTPYSIHSNIPSIKFSFFINDTKDFWWICLLSGHCIHSQIFFKTNKITTKSQYGCQSCITGSFKSPYSQTTKVKRNCNLCTKLRSNIQNLVLSQYLCHLSHTQDIYSKWFLRWNGISHVHNKKQIKFNNNNTVMSHIITFRSRTVRTTVVP